jgi:oligo-1,6-glucosidase
MSEKQNAQNNSEHINVAKNWWKEGIVYQIYPRSFKDSNGDGIGDLQGIISKLNYIQSLGVDIVWLNPIFASPNDDNGYDVSDYCAIMPEFGTMEDFDLLLTGLHERNMKLVIDGVFNHSSDEHFWFQQSRSARTNKYRDYYHWWPAEKGKPQHRFSFFDENSDAWKYDELTDAYYLHYFSVKQPDLNWENPKLRQEIYNIMRFWLDKGVDGFRLDVISFISKDVSFPPIPEMYNNDFPRYYANGPHLHQYLQEMNKEVFSNYNCMTVGECVAVDINDALQFVDKESKALNMFFHFDSVDYGYKKNEFKQPDPEGWKLTGFKEIFSKWNDAFADKGWGSIYLGNHDQPRMVSRWGNDSPEYREASSKMLLTFLLTMRSTPYIYMGDEIGMKNIRFTDIEDYRDIDTLKNYHRIKNTNGDVDYFMEGQKATARDNARTPFQWNNEAQAGFTNGQPWINVNSDAPFINVAKQEIDEDSVLNYFRHLVQLRKQNLILVYGDYKLLDKDNEQVYTFIRKDEIEEILVLLNFAGAEAEFTLPGQFKIIGTILSNNYNELKIKDGIIIMQPYQAIVIKQ